ncbi:MAG: hypothetical protein LBQ24_06370 [Candidatus Peribacteria bacterium]|jgi:hypothetical protein|nr:hypothetical protein [Candidatus Peribacteria bacterium]
MKKIFVFLLGSTLLFFSSFSLINADFWDDIFDNKKEIPYCNDGDC